jgi:hypothetical protein
MEYKVEVIFQQHCDDLQFQTYIKSQLYINGSHAIPPVSLNMD